jgi:hypothetical protein
MKSRPLKRNITMGKKQVVRQVNFDEAKKLIEDGAV